MKTTLTASLAVAFLATATTRADEPDLAALLRAQLAQLAPLQNAAEPQSAAPPERLARVTTGLTTGSLQSSSGVESVETHFR